MVYSENPAEVGRPGMSTPQTRDVVFVCNKISSRMQAVADLLLLQTDLRPVHCETTDRCGNSYVTCREMTLTRVKGVLVTVLKLVDQLYSYSTRWQDITSQVQDLGELVVTLTELTTHATYLLTSSLPQCVPARSGVLRPYVVLHAVVQVRLACEQLRLSSRAELAPALLVAICCDVNRHLATLTELCRGASEQPGVAEADREQFRLAVRSFTACAASLLQSIKVFKDRPSEAHLRRCVGFSEALVASTVAVAGLAREDDFIGRPAKLSDEAKDLRKSLLGACLSVVSSCVQLTHTVRELAYDNRSDARRARLLVCRDSLQRAASQLSDLLLRWEAGAHGRVTSPAVSPARDLPPELLQHAFLSDVTGAYPPHPDRPPAQRRRSEPY